MIEKKMNYYLRDESIFDVVSIIRSKAAVGERHSTLLFVIDWLKREGIAQESRQRIIELVTDHNKLILSKDDSEVPVIGRRKKFTILNDPTQQDNRIPLLINKEDASRISSILRAIIPSRQDFMHSNGRVPFQVENIVYGILSYCGPTLVICDYETRQIVKGIVISRWDKAGTENKIIHYHDVIALACPLDLVIYE